MLQLEPPFNPLVSMPSSRPSCVPEDNSMPTAILTSAPTHDASAPKVNVDNGESSERKEQNYSILLAVSPPPPPPAEVLSQCHCVPIKTSLYNVFLPPVLAQRFPSSISVNTSYCSNFEEYASMVCARVPKILWSDITGASVFEHDGQDFRFANYFEELTKPRRILLGSMNLWKCRKSKLVQSKYHLFSAELDPTSISFFWHQRVLSCSFLFACEWTSSSFGNFENWVWRRGQTSEYEPPSDSLGKIWERRQ